MTEITIDTLHLSARSNMAKTRELEDLAAREMRLAILAANPWCRRRAEHYMDDARVHRKTSRWQYREAAKLEAERRKVEGRAA